MQEEPKKDRREAKVTPKILKWVKNMMPHTCCIEIKCIKDGGKYYFSSDGSLKKEIRNLKICKTGFVKKYSDAMRTSTPFDAVFIKDAPGYFIIHWKRKGNKNIVLIPVEALEAYIKEGNKYLDEEAAQYLGSIGTLR